MAQAGVRRGDSFRYGSNDLQPCTQQQQLSRSSELEHGTRAVSAWQRNRTSLDSDGGRSRLMGAVVPKSGGTVHAVEDRNGGQWQAHTKNSRDACLLSALFLSAELSAFGIS